MPRDDCPLAEPRDQWLRLLNADLQKLTQEYAFVHCTQRTMLVER